MGVSIEIDDLALSVRFTGLDRMWALSRGITVSLAAVSAARVTSRLEALEQKPKLRTPGTYFPGAIVAGTYRQPGRRPQLWCVRDGHDVLVIDLIAQRYERVVVEVPDPRRFARTIEIARTRI
jgi:hypothetical protein